VQRPVTTEPRSGCVLVVDDMAPNRLLIYTVIGDRLCGQLRSLRAVRPIVRNHHEKLDGSGYPDGVQGDAIPLLAQITGAVDVYDALMMSRPYKPAFTHDEALAEIYGEVDRGWRSRELVDAFCRSIDVAGCDGSDRHRSHSPSSPPSPDHVGLSSLAPKAARTKCALILRAGCSAASRSRSGPGRRRWPSPRS